MKTLLQKGEERELKVNKKAVQAIIALIATGLPQGRDLEILEDMKLWYETNKFLVAGHRAKIKQIIARYDDYAYEKELRDAVITLYNEDFTPPGAANFIVDVAAAFDANNRFTPLQREQLIGIHRTAEVRKRESLDGGDGDVVK